MFQTVLKKAGPARFPCLAAVTACLLLSCPQPPDPEPGKTFVPVTDITGIPTGATAETPLALTGTVQPANATNQTIVWTVQSGPATVSGNTLNATAAGTVQLIAVIANGSAQGTAFSKNVSITVNAAGTFVPVTDITGLPTAATAGTPLVLTSTVEPSNATNQTIVWAVQSGPATVSGNTLNATAAGTVNLTATIANGSAQGTAYTKNCSITVNAAFVPVTDITGLPVTAVVGTPLTLSGMVEPSNATNQTIVWAVQSGPATVSGNTLNATAAGTVQLTATIASGSATGTAYTKNVSITVLPNNADYTINVSLWVNESDGSLLASPSGTQTIAKSTDQSLTFTVNSGYTDIAWYVDGRKTAEGQTSFTMKARDYPIAVHQVMVLLYKDGKPWSSGLPVKVTN
jgi:endo-1,4-beta-xylanase